MTAHAGSGTLARMSNTDRPMDRRAFLARSGAVAALTGLAGSGMARTTTRKADEGEHPGDNHRGRCALSSWNGLPATARAMELVEDGRDPLEAAVGGVALLEDDPDDMTVGYGGLPNEEGVVELDASVMHGPLHAAGSVASLRNIRHPTQVAMRVMQRTDHVMLVGEGALRFARNHGFQEENLLTERARRAWLRWRENLSPEDNWLDDDQKIRFPVELEELSEEERRSGRYIPYTYGTIHCSVLDGNGDMAATTTTSGLSYKLPGRIGDSPIVGAGMYVDNDIGAAGATGRGEAVIQVCGSHTAVEMMDRGLTPTEACLEVLKRIADKTREKRLQDSRGRPNFNVVMYALRKDGAYGSACLFAGRQFTVHDGTENRKLDCAYLFESR